MDAVVSNPVEQAEPPKTRRAVPAHWSPDEARRFLGLHEGDRLYPLWAFMLSAGVRVGELVWLRWINVHLEDRYVRLNEFPTTIGYRLTASAGKNQTAVRTIDLDDHLVTVLELQRDQQRHEQAQPGYEEPSTCSPSLLVVTTTLRRSRNASGVSPSSLDCLALPLTGSAISVPTGCLLEAYKPRSAAERLGHADTRMFSNVYSHVTPTMQREAAEKLGDTLFGGEPAREPVPVGV